MSVEKRADLHQDDSWHAKAAVFLVHLNDAQMPVAVQFHNQEYNGRQRPHFDHKEYLLSTRR